MMMFWVIAILLIAGALLFILPPLFKREQPASDLSREALNIAIHRDQLRELDNDLKAGTISQEQYEQAKLDIEKGVIDSISGDDKAHTRAGAELTAKASAWVVLIALPLVSIFFYQQFGAGAPGINPEVPPPQASQQEQMHNIEQMVSSLETKLAENPNDAQGWAMLGRSYYFLRQNEKAVSAYKKAIELGLDYDANIFADLADTLAVVNNMTLAGEPMTYIERALQIDPQHVKALYLAASAKMQTQEYAKAKEYWVKILGLMPPGSEGQAAVQAAIAEVDGYLGVSSSPAAPVAAAGPASVSGRVSLADDHPDTVKPDDTVFVFARAANGPRMPLAIVRKQVRDLPFEFTLDDSMAMNPAMKLSSFSEIVVGARVSKSGNAMPQPGDLEGTSPVIRLGDGKKVDVIINGIVE
ncbi:MAG: c-type cytochrome biogenesis protein CcmI [Pseudomonadota bacterium]